jgi:hypothetical protein
LEILDGFRAAGVPARRLLTDASVCEAWERFGTNTDAKGRSLGSRQPRPVSHLSSGERSSTCGWAHRNG